MSNDYQTEPAVQGNLGHCPLCGALGMKREIRPNGFDYCPNGHRYTSALATKKSLHLDVDDLFEKYGVVAEYRKDENGEGLLAFPSGKVCEDPWSLQNVPICGNGAYLTCFCQSKAELFAALSTAAAVANAVIVFDTVYSPGDERSKSHPGHGYPESYENSLKYIVMNDMAELETWIAKRDKHDRAYVVIQAEAKNVKTKLTVSLT